MRGHLIARLAVFEDWQNILAWRNDPLTRQFSKTHDPIGETQHKEWLSRFLKSKDHFLFVVESADGGEPLGLVRFEPEISHGKECLVSINLNPKNRGQGLAKQILRLGIQAYDELSPDVLTLIAEIDASNHASIKTFSANGFEGSPDQEGVHLIYRYPKMIVAFESTSLKRVSGTRNQIHELYKLLKNRAHSISHSEVPSIRQHDDFVCSYPYRHWFLVKNVAGSLGAIYLAWDNSVGINVDLPTEQIQLLIECVAKNFDPLPEIKSVRSKCFHINVPVGAEVLESAVKKNGVLIQKTYRITK